MKKKKPYNPPPGQYIVVNPLGEVWTGIRGKEIAFSRDWNSAKPLSNQNQFDYLHRMTYDKLEQLFL